MAGRLNSSSARGSSESRWYVTNQQCVKDADARNVRDLLDERVWLQSSSGAPLLLLPRCHIGVCLFSRPEENKPSHSCTSATTASRLWRTYNYRLGNYPRRLRLALSV